MPKTITSIHDQFEHFRQIALPGTLTPDQKQTASDIFHGGFTSALLTLTDEIQALPTEQGIIALCSLRQEAHAYADKRSRDANGGN